MKDKITLIGDFSDSKSLMLKKAFDDSMIDKHKLSDQVRGMYGASGVKYRQLINNLIATITDPRYLEIGCFTGSTLCSAVYGNKVNATCIDNWSWPFKVEFEKNVNAILNDDINVTLIENDFRAVNYSDIGKHNVYMFDGPHEEMDQYDGVAIVQNALEDEFILIVDDYNDPKVQRGTQNAIRNLNLKVVSSIEVSTPSDGPRNEQSDWHFGYFISVIRK
jgi:hypothetical protein